MCGIALVWSTDPVMAEHACAKAVSALDHRGPDSQGIESFSAPGGALTMGHARLAIIDLSSAGSQPMLDPQSGNAIVFNGEIYNFRSLRAELQRLGYSWRGNSDTEVLLKGYTEWGVGVFDRLRGMFAVAIWNPTSGKLVLARDHIGMKPLYWSRSQAGFVVASELRAVLATQMVLPDIDRAGIAGLLAYGSVPEPKTVVQGISMLESGCFWELDLHNQSFPFNPVSYWRMPGEVRQFDENNSQSVLDTAVKRHLESDVPVGVFLSAGVDSTAIAESTARVASATVKTFTVGFPDHPEIDEASIAEQTSSALGFEHHSLRLSDSDITGQFDNWIASLDQPSLDGFNTYVVAQAARATGLKVALSGLGGDELFGGYSTFRQIPLLWKLGCLMRWLPERPRQLLFMAASAPLGRDKSRKLVEASSEIDDVVSLVLRKRRVFSDAWIQQLGFERSALSLNGRYHAPERRLPEMLRSIDIEAIVAACETDFYMRDTLLRDSDVSGMAHGFEIRMPLLDRDLMEMALSLPKHQRMSRRDGNKPILAKAAGPHTQRISKRTKRGFTLPYANWMNGVLRPRIEFGLEVVKQSGIVAKDPLASISSQLGKERSNTSWSRLWLLATFGLWLDAQSRRMLDAMNPRRSTVT